MLPNLSNQNGESSMLRRLLGSSGISHASLDKKLSPETRKAQQAVLDSMLDPCSVEGMAAMAVQEPHRSSCFANLHKFRTELSNKPAAVVPNDLYKTNRIIAVRSREMKQTTQQEKNSDTLELGKDGRPLKSLHWKALRRSTTEYNKKHKCEGNSWNCEKCRRVLEIRKATERFEAKRAAKKALQESITKLKAAEEAEDEVQEMEQRIKLEERFCRIAAPNARTVVQRSKTAPGEEVSFFPVGGNSKWAQPVLSEMPKGVYMGRLIDYDHHTAPIVDEEIKLEHDERKIPSCVAKLKYLREYLDDEPDFESEKIAPWELAPRSHTNVVFIPPGWCERKCEAPRSLEPRIRIIDTSCGENDGFAYSTESRGIASLRKLLPGKSQVTEVIELTNQGSAESWSDVVITLQELDEKDSVEFDCDSEEKFHCDKNAIC